ncbi:hypothetical protein, partial [Bradyrhizobium sp.]|uniref:hypothetical protein n=1 Tax=Bradyrhizobium sp. TaxID=376 RepID=UPI0025C18C6B
RDTSVQAFLLCHRRNHDRLLAALGEAKATRYFATEVDGIGKEGTNQPGAAQAHSILKRRTVRLRDSGGLRLDRDISKSKAPPALKPNLDRLSRTK